VIDTYTTTKASYREIACLVSGPRSSAVVVAAAPTAIWDQQAAALQRAVSSFDAQPTSGLKLSLPRPQIHTAQNNHP
jgi:hypothetical protein